MYIERGSIDLIFANEAKCYKHKAPRFSMLFSAGEDHVAADEMSERCDVIS
jgi:hypothetical protein